MADKMAEWWPKYAEVPKRLSYLPNSTDRDSFALDTREAAIGDIRQLRLLMRLAGHPVTNAVIRRWLTSCSFTARVTVRNERFIVAACVAEPRIDLYENRLWLYCHPDYLTTLVPLRLIQLARLEMPELPAVVEVKADDTETQLLLLDVGWTELTYERDNADRLEYRIGSVAPKQYRAALASRGRVRQAPAND